MPSCNFPHRPASALSATSVTGGVDTRQRVEPALGRQVPDDASGRGGDLRDHPKEKAVAAPQQFAACRLAKRNRQVGGPVGVACRDGRRAVGPAQGLTDKTLLYALLHRGGQQVQIGRVTSLGNPLDQRSQQGSCVERCCFRRGLRNHHLGQLALEAQLDPQPVADRRLLMIGKDDGCGDHPRHPHDQQDQRSAPEDAFFLLPSRPWVCQRLGPVFGIQADRTEAHTECRGRSHAIEFVPAEQQRRVEQQTHNAGGHQQRQQDAAARHQLPAEGRARLAAVEQHGAHQDQGGAGVGCHPARARAAVLHHTVQRFPVEAERHVEEVFEQDGTAAEHQDGRHGLSPARQRRTRGHQQGRATQDECNGGVEADRVRPRQDLPHRLDMEQPAGDQFDAQHQHEPSAKAREQWSRGHRVELNHSFYRCHLCCVHQRRTGAGSAWDD